MIQQERWDKAHKHQGDEGKKKGGIFLVDFFCFLLPFSNENVELRAQCVSRAS